ncbi:MmpS family transport accessory protein [Saccharothrix stipae]
MTSATGTRADRRPPRKPAPGRRTRSIATVVALAVAGTAAWTITSQEPDPVPTTHKVVYEVTGPGGKAPAIRFATEGVNTTEQAEAVDLPWRREVVLPAGPGLGVAQVMATNGEGESISCTITIDGNLVANNTAKGEHATVSCSNMITPAIGGR